MPVILDAPAPDTPPLTPVVVIGADQLYVVPNGTIPLIPLVGEARNATPLHVTVLIDVIFTRGLSVRVNWNDAPVQPLVNGITVYVALCAVLVGLVRLPLILVCVNAAAPPVTPPVTIGADQLYVVPAGITPLVTFVGVNTNATPVQAVPVIAVTAASGLIVTVNWNVAPLPHATVFGVIVYVANCTVLVELNKVAVILDAPDPDTPPLTPVVVIGADQL